MSKLKIDFSICMYLEEAYLANRSKAKVVSIFILIVDVLNHKVKSFLPKL